jgi:hypothetical protein
MRKDLLLISQAEHDHNRRRRGRRARNAEIESIARQDFALGETTRLESLAGKYVELDIPWDEVNHPEHRRLAMEVRAEGLAEEKSAFEQRQRDYASKYPKPVLLCLVFLALVFLETLGNSLVTRDLGVEGIERWIFALLLSLAVFLLVFLSSENHSKKGFNLWYAVTIAALGCIVVAITLMRVTHGTDDLVYVIAEGVIFGTCTIGAAVGSHRVFDVWRNASPEWRALKVARRHLKEHLQKQATAAADIANIKRTSEWRARQVHQIQSVYDLAHKQSPKKWWAPWTA